MFELEGPKAARRYCSYSGALEFILDEAQTAADFAQGRATPESYGLEESDFAWKQLGTNPLQWFQVMMKFLEAVICMGFHDYNDLSHRISEEYSKDMQRAKLERKKKQLAAEFEKLGKMHEEATA